jgi:hypothetical protein
VSDGEGEERDKFGARIGGRGGQVPQERVRRFGPRWWRGGVPWAVRYLTPRSKSRLRSIEAIERSRCSQKAG